MPAARQFASHSIPRLPGRTLPVSLAKRDRGLFSTETTADREREELIARQRVGYRSRAQEERDRNSFMMILTLQDLT